MCEPPLEGCPYTDSTQICAPDRMHVDGKGVLLDMLKSLRSSLDEDELDAISTALDADWTASRPAALPKGGLHALDNKLTANQVVALAKCLVVPLSRINSGASEALAGYLEWMLVRDAGQHSESDLRRLAECRVRAQELILEHFPRGRWGYKPKFLAMREFEVSIRLLGNVEATSADYGERSHRDVKAAYPFNNHHPEAVLQQVMLQVECTQAAAKAIALAERRRSSPAMHFVARANATGEPQAPRISPITLHLHHLRAMATDLPSEVQAFLARQPELVGVDGLEVHLAKELDLGASVQQVPIGAIKGRQVQVKEKCAVMARMHRGNPEQAVTVWASFQPASGGGVRARFSDVAIKSPQGEEDWLGQVRLFFRVTFNDQYHKLYAFVRWYQQAELRLPGHRLMCLRWAPGTDSSSPRYSVVGADTILHPVVLQPHPSQKARWVLNHFFSK